MTIDQLEVFLTTARSEANLPGHTEVVIEDDAGDIFGIGNVEEYDGKLRISTGDLHDEQ